MSNNDIIYDLLSFLAVAVIFLIIVSILFGIFCKKFKFNSSRIDLYGLFLNLNNTSLIAIASITINYLFLVWCMISFKGLNIIYITLIFILMLVRDFVMDDYKKIPLSLVMGTVDCLAIELIYLIYNYLMNDSFSYMLLAILILVVIFVFLYFTYNLFRRINNIVVDHKVLKNKKYKV